MSTRNVFIQCIRRDNYGTIADLRLNDNNTFRLDDFIAFLRNNHNTIVWTVFNGRNVELRPRRSRIIQGNWYFAPIDNPENENFLDFLPECNENSS